VFDLSPEKILLLGVIAVIFLGPDRLPSAARTLAKVLHQFRTASGSLQAEMREVLAEPRQAVTDAVGDLGLPTDLGLPRIPTARSLVTQALSPPPASSRIVEASSTNGASVEGSSPGAPPDDPSHN
jgi:sec-independent protein translocase protein TatB